jgi:hypothetical protein
VNPDRIDVQLPSLICDHTIVKDPKGTPATVSLFDLQELQKNFLTNMYFDHIEAMVRRYCILHRLCPIFQFASEDIAIIGSRFFSKQNTCTVRRRQ